MLEKNGLINCEEIRLYGDYLGQDAILGDDFLWNYPLPRTDRYDEIIVKYAILKRRSKRKGCCDHVVEVLSKVFSFI